MEKIINHAVLSLDFWQDTVTYEGHTMPTEIIGCGALNIPDDTIGKLNTPCDVLNQLLQGLNTGIVDRHYCRKCRKQPVRSSLSCRPRRPSPVWTEDILKKSWWSSFQKNTWKIPEHTCSSPSRNSCSAHSQDSAEELFLLGEMQEKLCERITF